MTITLINIRSPKWKTLTKPRVDSDGNTVNDSDGKPIRDTLNDSDGNPIKVIDCECQWSHLGDNTQAWLSFSANKNDVAQHGRDLYNALVNGDHGAIAAE